MIHVSLCWLCIWCAALEPPRLWASAFSLLPHRANLSPEFTSPATARFATRKKKKKETPTIRAKIKAGAGFGAKKTSIVVNKTTRELDPPRAREANPEILAHHQQPKSEKYADTTIHSRITRRQKWTDEELHDVKEETESKVVTARKASRRKWANPAESSVAKAINTQEYQQQLEVTSSPKPGRLIQISQDPLIITIDDFIDPAACERVLANGAGCFDLLFPERLSDLLFQGQESEMDGLLFNAANSQQHSQKGIYPDGLHMDTNGQCLFRHVTCLLYLNTIPEECGGATIFPLARALPNDPALVASKRLLAEKISHSRSRAVEAAGLTSEALLLESRVGSNFLDDPDTQTAVRIQPKAGRLLIFFSRTSNGEEDPRAWHSGEQLKATLNAVGSSITEKRILTLFKEVHYSAVETYRAQPSLAQSTFEAFLAPQIQEQRKWLQLRAQDNSLVSCSTSR